MTTVVSILMSDIVPLRDRGMWQGVINIIYATGSGVGAPLGGILADYIGWRWYDANLDTVIFVCLSHFLTQYMQGFCGTVSLMRCGIYLSISGAQATCPR